MRTGPFCFCIVSSLGLGLHREGDVIWVGQFFLAEAEDAL